MEYTLQLFPRQILFEEAEKHGITYADLVSREKQAQTGPLREARQKAIERLHERGLSLSQIGRLMNRDHTTIGYHLRKNGLGCGRFGTKERQRWLYRKAQERKRQIRKAQKQMRATLAAPQLAIDS